MKSTNGECKRRIRYLLHAWTYRTFKQQNGVVPWNTGTSKPTILDDRRMQKGESNIFCMLGRIVLSNNKMVLYRGIPARQSQQYRTSGECKKENPISFACLDVSYFQTTKWYLYRGIPARRNQQYWTIGECKKENPISFACLDVLYFQTTKWYCLYRGIPARRNQQYWTIRECKKENPISFACLDIQVSYFLLIVEWMHSYTILAASKGTSSLNSKERIVTHLDILLVNDRL